MTSALDVDALPTLLISEDISSLFDDPFPFPPNTIAHITRRRRLLDNSLFFDRLLALGAIQDPTEVYPPHSPDSFRALLDAVAKSTYDSMKRDCLVYYLLKFTGDGRETKFAEERCLLPVYVSLIEAFWHFDDGNDLERAVSLYSDARIVKEHTSKIIQTLSLAPHPSSSALILRFVRTSTPALTEPDDIRLYLHALAEHDFVAAWEYTQTFAERSKERLEVLGELVAWVAINAPQHPLALKHLLALPLSPYEDAILNNFVTNPPPALLQPPPSAPSSTYLPSPSPSQSQSQPQPSTHHLKHNPVSFLRDLYTVKLIQSNRFVDAIKFDTRRAASSPNSYSEFDRKRIIDRVFGILTPLERADVGSGLGGMFNMKSASGSSQTPLKTQAMHIPTEDSPSNLNASTHRSFNSVNLNSSQSLGQSQTQAFALWSSTSTSSPSTFATPAHTRRDSGGSFTPQLSRSVNGSGKMKRSSLGSGFGGSPVGIGLGTPRKVAGLLPSVGVNGNGNANGGLLFTPGASTSTSTKPSAPLISSSTSSSLSRSGQSQSQSQHRVNGNGYAQNRSPVASSASVSPTGAVTATNVNGTANTTTLTPPSHRTNAFLAPNAFFKPPPVATSTYISPSSTGTGLGINGVQKSMARENEKNNGVVKNPKRKRARVSDFEDEMGDREEVEAEALGATSSLKSKNKATLNGKTKAKPQTRKVSSSKTVATAAKRSKQEQDEDGEGVEEEEHYGRDRDSDTHVNPPGAFIEVNVDTETDVNTLPASSSLDSLTSATSSNKSKRVRQSGTTTATGTGTGTRARSRSRGGSLSSSVVPASVQVNGTSENHESSSGTTTTKRTSRKRPAPTSPVIERISIPGTLFEEDEDEDEVNNGHRRNSNVLEPSSSSTLTVPARATKIRKLANGSTKKSGRYSRASSVGVSVDGDAQQTDDASVDEHGDGDGDDNSGSVPPESTRTRTEKTKSKSTKTVRRSTRLSTVVISPSESKGGEGEGDVRSSKPRKSTRGSKRK